MSDLPTNLAAIRRRIDEACRRAGRAPEGVTLLPVSKTHPPECIRRAHAAGLSRFGENKVQEARAKAEATGELDLRWCMIGPIQTNKVKYLVHFAAEVHSLDRLKLAQELDRRLQGAGRGMDVLVQVNTSGEAQKSGLAPEQVLSFARELSVFSSLRVRGLMTLAVHSPDREEVRRCFQRLRAVQEQLRQDGPEGLSWDALSMGMSGDFDLAIAEGSTEVRVGQALFGPRPRV